MQSLLQIIVVNPVREITMRATGNKFTVQDAECMLLDDGGKPVKVGVLRIPEPLRKDVRPGVFIGTFGLDAGYKDRQIEAILTGLQEVELTPKGPVAKSIPQQPSKAV